MTRTRKLRTWLVILLALGAAACTSGFVYNRLDTVARWYIGSLVTLDDSQQQALRLWLRQTLDWHRDNELARYEQFVRRLAAKAMGDADPAAHTAALEEAETFMHEFAAQVAPEAAELLATLTPAQVEELLANLKKRDEEELEEERGRTDAQRQKRRVRSFTRMLERWTGAASSDQKRIIERQVAGMAAAGLLGENEDWLASREAWREELRGSLAGTVDRERLLALLREPQRTHTAAHRAAETARREHTLALVAELDATLSAQQRTTLVRKLNELAEDLGALQARS